MEIIKTLFYRHGKSSKPNKAWELQIMWEPEIKPIFELSANYGDGISFDFNLFEIVSLAINKSEKTDHAGWRIGLKIFGLSAEYSYYDIRHWDNETGTFEV